MKCTTFIWSTILATVLATSMALAGPRQAPQPLSPGERACKNLGDLAYFAATERDRGVSYVFFLGIVRQWNEVDRLDADNRAINENVVRRVFQYPTVSPARFRQQTEWECVDAVNSPDPLPSR